MLYNMSYSKRVSFVCTETVMDNLSNCRSTTCIQMSIWYVCICMCESPCWNALVIYEESSLIHVNFIRFWASAKSVINQNPFIYSPSNFKIDFHSTESGCIHKYKNSINVVERRCLAKKMHRIINLSNASPCGHTQIYLRRKGRKKISLNWRLCKWTPSATRVIYLLRRKWYYPFNVLHISNNLNMLSILPVMCVYCQEIEK